MGVFFVEFDLLIKFMYYKFENVLEWQGIVDVLLISVKYVGFENYYLSVWLVGVLFFFVLVKDVVMFGEVDFDLVFWECVVFFMGGYFVFVYVYCCSVNGIYFQVCMFLFDMGIVEDFVIGVVVVGFFGVIYVNDKFLDGYYVFVIV